MTYDEIKNPWNAQADQLQEHPQLLPCPFCGAKAHGYVIEPHTHSPALKAIGVQDCDGSYVIEGLCKCGSGLIGGRTDEVIERWNRRTTATEAGNPASGAQDKNEPVAYLWQHTLTGERKALMDNDVFTAGPHWKLVGPLFLASEEPDELDDQDDDFEDGECPSCSGTGEGMFDGQSCAVCRGKGFR